jgi:hypothetical protein
VDERICSHVVSDGENRAAAIAADIGIIQQIAPDYNVAQWRNDTEVNRDLRQLFRQYSTKSPLLEGVLKALIERARGCEAKFEGADCSGLLVAYLLDCLAISLPSDPAWNVDRLQITVVQLDEEEGYVRESNDTVLNCSTPKHAMGHAPEFERRRRSLVADGRDLVDQKEQLLPHVILCRDVEATLRNLAPNDPCFVWVRRCLFELNDLCNDLSDGEFHHQQLISHPTRESESVRSNEELRRLRIFTCPDGEQRFFEWHLKHYGLNFRLHYFPKVDDRTVLVGYFGHHLPTSLY